MAFVEKERKKKKNWHCAVPRMAKYFRNSFICNFLHFNLHIVTSQSAQEQQLAVPQTFCFDCHSQQNGVCVAEVCGWVVEMCSCFAHTLWWDGGIVGWWGGRGIGGMQLTMKQQT